MSEHPGIPGPDAADRDLRGRVADVTDRLRRLLEAAAAAQPDDVPPEAGEPLRSFVHRVRDALRSDPAGTAAAPPVPGTPLAHLTEALGLDPAELVLLVAAGLVEEDGSLAKLIRETHPRSEPRITVGLAARLVEDATGREEAAGRLRHLLHEGPATASGLLVVTGEEPFSQRSLVPAEAIWPVLHGIDAWPASLPRVVAQPPPAGLGGWLELPAVSRTREAIREGRDVVLLVAADDEVVALSRCAALAAVTGRPAVAARVGAAGADATRALLLHAAARGGLPVLVVEGDTAPDDSGWPGAVRLPGLAPFRGPVAVCAPPGRVLPPADRAIVAVPVGPIGLEDRRSAWRAALPGTNGGVAVLEARHPLDPAVTGQVALDVAASGRAGRVDVAEVSALIRARAGARLPAGVRLRTPEAGWDRLVLPEVQATQLREGVDRLRHHATVLDDWGLRDAARADRGVRMLFAGPPGTGKSLAAEVVARAAATDLLVVDLSRIVSKWLGETEKNLAAVFDVAERTQAVLFLDEADALFASRTDVDDAHDRYANQGTAWLLQRLDRFDGLAVLATNLRHNIDVAFVRRMDLVIEFTQPDEGGRLRLWEQHLPVRVRDGDTDLPALARRYPVSGAWIRNAALSAAFAAAAEGGLVGQRHLVAAVAREYEKAVRPMPASPSPPPGGHDQEAAEFLARPGRKE